MFSYDSHFFGNVHVRVASRIFFSKNIGLHRNVVLVFNMVKGSILEVEFIVISRGKKLLGIEMNWRPFFLLSLIFFL